MLTAVLLGRKTARQSSQTVQMKSRRLEVAHRMCIQLTEMNFIS